MESARWLGAGLQVSLIFWGWALAQYPFLLPPDFTIRGTAAPATTLRLTLIALLIGGVILLPSLWYLFQIFKSVPADPAERPGMKTETAPRLSDGFIQSDSS